MTPLASNQLKTWRLATPEATRGLGATVARALMPGDILLLEGELGSGKTTFTQGLAGGLGVAGDVLSPTFALMSEYRQGRIPLLHVDAFRLENAGEADQLGLDEYLDHDWAVVVEWAGNITGALPHDALTLHFEHDGDARLVTFSAGGTRSGRLLEEVYAPGSRD